VQITFEVEIDYGPDGPGESEPSPTERDIEEAVREGLVRRGFHGLGVTAVRL